LIFSGISCKELTQVAQILTLLRSLTIIFTLMMALVAP